MAVKMGIIWQDGEYKIMSNESGEITHQVIGGPCGLYGWAFCCCLSCYVDGNGEPQMHLPGTDPSTVNYVTGYSIYPTCNNGDGSQGAVVCGDMTVDITIVSDESCHSDGWNGCQCTTICEATAVFSYDVPCATIDADSKCYSPWQATASSPVSFSGDECPTGTEVGYLNDGSGGGEPDFRYTSMDVVQDATTFDAVALSFNYAQVGQDILDIEDCAGPLQNVWVKMLGRHIYLKYVFANGQCYGFEFNLAKSSSGDSGGGYAVSCQDHRNVINSYNTDADEATGVFGSSGNPDDLCGHQYGVLEPQTTWVDLMTTSLGLKSKRPPKYYGDVTGLFWNDWSCGRSEDCDYEYGWSAYTSNYFQILTISDAAALQCWDDLTWVTSIPSTSEIQEVTLETSTSGACD